MLKLLTNEIVRLLQLDDNENKHKIIDNLLKNGRQSLSKYQDDIIVGIYTIQMNGNDNDLMKLLKTYIEQQWKMLDTSSDKLFVSFIEKYKNGENPDWYEQILIRTAEYGNKYMKNCPLLSITLQLLFDGIDDECLNEKNIFDDLWMSVTMKGLSSTIKYSKYIGKIVMNKLVDKKQPILFQVLREYYRQDLFDLLKNQCKISNRENLYELALDNVTEYGWKIGLEKIQDNIPANKFEMLLKNLDRFLQQQRNITSPKKFNTEKLQDTPTQPIVTHEDKGNYILIYLIYVIRF